MRADEGLASAALAADPKRGLRLRTTLATGAFWLVGSALVAVAQPSAERGTAAIGAAVAGIATILAVSRLTPDAERRYFRSVVGAMVAVSLVGDWLLQHLVSGANGFVEYGMDTRIALPLIVVLLVPLVLQAMPVRLRSRALWRERSQILREARPLDWLTATYVLLIVPDLILGVAYHAPKTYIAQDLGLIVFFVFAYVAGRAVSARAGKASAGELVVVLLLLGVAQLLLGWDTTPIFTYVEAASAGAIAFAVLQPTRTRLLWLLLPALVLLAHDAWAIKNGTGSTTAVQLAAALGIVAYLLVRVRHLLPQWLIVVIAAAALAGFLAFTADGATVRGQYHGTDESNLGRTYEAHQVREATHTSPLAFVFGRGLGGTINETQAPRLFAESLVYGGRDLAQVQEVHLLPYEFLLKYGVLGFAWVVAFVVGVVILGIRALEAATRQRDPTPVVYAALPLLGIAAALAAATHLQDNPLNAFAVGVLVTRFGGVAEPRPRLGVAVPAAAAIAAVAGAIAFAGHVGKFVFPGYAGAQGGLNATVLAHVRVNYPFGFHTRRFATSNPRITGVHGARVQGVVIASYPLRRSPQLGGTGTRFRPDGVFFELYRLPRRAHPTKVNRLPVTIFDFPDTAGLPPATEQGATFFKAKGRDYRAILWLGPRAPLAARVLVDEIVASMQVSRAGAAPHARGRPGTPPHRRR